MLGSFFEFARILNLRIVAEFVLNGAHLLVQEVFALLFVEVFAHFVLNFVAHFQDLNFGGEVLEHKHNAFFHVHFFEHRLLFSDVSIHVGRNEIHEETRAVDVAYSKLRL